MELLRVVLFLCHHPLSLNLEKKLFSAYFVWFGLVWLVPLTWDVRKDICVCVCVRMMHGRKYYSSKTKIKRDKTVRDISYKCTVYKSTHTSKSIIRYVSIPINISIYLLDRYLLGTCFTTYIRYDTYGLDLEQNKCCYHFFKSHMYLSYFHLNS